MQKKIAFDKNSGATLSGCSFVRAKLPPPPSGQTMQLNDPLKMTHWLEKYSKASLYVKTDAAGCPVAHPKKILIVN